MASVEQARAILAYPSRCELGEGSLWDPVTGRLYWVDICDHKAMIFDPGNGSSLSYDMGQPRITSYNVCYTKLLRHVSLANVLHKIGDEEGAQKHHERAIALDPEYAPHHFNYANTLYDLGRKEEALVGYTKAYELDNTLDEAKKMMKELGSNNG